MKNVAENIPAHVLRQIRREIEMAKKRTRDIGTEILEGIREIRRGEIGRVVTYPPVAETSSGAKGGLDGHSSSALQRQRFQ